MNIVRISSVRSTQACGALGDFSVVMPLPITLLLGQKLNSLHWVHLVELEADDKALATFALRQGFHDLILSVSLSILRKESSIPPSLREISATSLPGMERRSQAETCENNGVDAGAARDSSCLVFMCLR